MKSPSSTPPEAFEGKTASSPQKNISAIWQSIMILILLATLGGPLFLMSLLVVPLFCVFVLFAWFAWKIWKEVRANPKKTS